MIVSPAEDEDVQTGSTFAGVDIDERDNEIAEETVEPLKVSIKGFTSLGVLTLQFNRSLNLKRRSLAAESMAQKLDQLLEERLSL